MKWVQLGLAVVLVLLVRKLCWCVRWLWCYYRGRALPPPIGILPGRPGRTFEGHLRKDDEEG